MRITLFIATVIIFFSCGGTKKVYENQSTQRGKKEQTRTKRGMGKVDTVSWTEIDRTKEYNQELEDLELDKRSSYKVALLFPFSMEDSDVLDVNSSNSKLGRIARFYAGVKLGLAQLQEEGVTLEVHAFDSESGNFDNKLRECIDADIIIGPRERGQLATTVQFGKSNGIPVISPWFSSTKLAKDNPNYIQLKPSLKRHMAEIVNHVKQNYEDDQVFVLGRKTKKDIPMVRYIQEMARVNRSGLSSRPFKEFMIEEDSLASGGITYDSIFYKDKTTVFILPHWSFSDDERFIYNAVRKLSGEKGLNDVVLYGMPILLESDLIQFEHYANLNMRICRNSYLDREDPAVKDFRTTYYESYKDFPSEEVYKGFDMMMFLGRSIYNYGKKFQYFLDTYESSLFQTEFDVLKVFNTQNDDRFQNIQYFQNEHLYILEFKDNQFIKTKI